MVFRGKLSAACAECRRRKTKCDLSQPSCGQCVRTGRVCSGPRDDSDRIFVHQTEKIAYKGRRKQQSLSQSRTSPEESALLEISRSREPKITTFSSGIPDQSLDDLGIGWFLRARGHSCLPFAMQHDFFSSYHHRLSEPGIRQTLVAVGLAGYAKETRQHRLMHSAEINYAKAVQTVQSVLSTPNVAMRDGVLFSIMMLIMFEGNTWRRISGSQNFANHMNGILACSSLSIKQDNPSTLHKQLIAFIAGAFLFQCWYMHRPLPSEFFIVHEKADFDPAHIQATLMDIVIAIVQFETLIQGKTAHFWKIIASGTQLDTAIQSFLDGIPLSRRWHEQNLEGFPHLLYQGAVHLYPSTHSAIHHNLLRLSQIHCNLMVMDHCHMELLRHSAYTNKKAILARLSSFEAAVKRVAKDICASIPQLADYLDLLGLQDYVFHTSCHMKTPHQSMSALLELSPFLVYSPNPIETDDLPPRADGSRKPKPDSLYHAFWALSSLVEISFLDEEMSRWIKERLFWIEANSPLGDLSKLRAMKQDIKRRINLGLYKC